ncbi:uncharacterized protein KY384_008777 [Bacidia gigantensis]|uniref:uncharacterized protein n=1 Tax=Bacidia gigantensis TaxID=2732470 RepID=UPI001D041174|nr:uncharacterized protein KY384_008777 [Bacidia gigantensis]KAG8526576.1 hypothetical protein KY384_008777 [Bacidia gigantensis]
MVTDFTNGNDTQTSNSKSSSSFKPTLKASGTFPRNGPDPSARPWSHDESGITFSAQRRLPKQPLPSLESSCERYLEAVKPLQLTEEHKTTVDTVKDFLSGEGSTLQAQLGTYNENHVNYFEHFCYEAFLGDDSPVVLNSNAFCSFIKDPTASRNDQISRAASLVRSTVTFSQKIRNDELPLDEFRGVPQCMNQYWWLFGVTRIPEDDGGRLRMDVDATHIMVMCQGQIYSLEVLEESTNKIINQADLCKALQDIVDDANAVPVDLASRSSIGVFTTEHQKVWARCRKELIRAGLQNGRSIGLIDSSLFVLCLDDSSPETETDICRNMICGTDIVKGSVQVGTCLNRWYDKLAIIVCRNGEAGMNFEHTCTDGSVDIAMACEIYKGSILHNSSTPKNSSTPATSSTLPITNGMSNGTISSVPTKMRKLTFTIPDALMKDLLLAQEHLATRISAHQLSTLHHSIYGSQFIKSTAKVSPDAFFQLVLQAAHYTTYEKVVSGFEPVLMRQYLHGRTDVSRTTTQEALDFAKAYHTAQMSGGQAVSFAHVITLLKKAAIAHADLSKRCAAGVSHHRHLYVLQQLWKRRRAFMEVNRLKDPTTEKPTIFEDPGWSKLNTTVLMGSNVENDCLAYAGFGPPSADGFTVCYFIRKDEIAMSVNSRNGEADRFMRAIEGVLVGLKDMMEEQ